MIDSPNLFKWRHYQPEIIVLCVRWYLRYALSYRDLGEIMLERGLDVDHSTLNRWVLRYAPELDKRCRPHLKMTNSSYRVDETYIKVRRAWKYLYRAVDSEGNALDFTLSPQRDKQAAKRFFQKVLASEHVPHPRAINVDKNPSFPKAIAELKKEGELSKDCKLRRIKYLNNIVEQDHRFIKRLVRPGLGFFSFVTACQTLAGFEIMNMIRKGQIQGTPKGDILGQICFISRVLGLAS